MVVLVLLIFGPALAVWGPWQRVLGGVWPLRPWRARNRPYALWHLSHGHRLPALGKNHSREVRGQDDSDLKPLQADAWSHPHERGWMSSSDSVPLNFLRILQTWVPMRTWSAMGPWASLPLITVSSGIVILSPSPQHLSPGLWIDGQGGCPWGAWLWET